MANISGVSPVFALARLGFAPVFRSKRVPTSGAQGVWCLRITGVSQQDKKKQDTHKDPLCVCFERSYRALIGKERERERERERAREREGGIVSSTYLGGTGWIKALAHSHTSTCIQVVITLPCTPSDNSYASSKYG